MGAARIHVSTCPQPASQAPKRDAQHPNRTPILDASLDVAARSSWYLTMQTLASAGKWGDREHPL